MPETPTDSPALDFLYSVSRREIIATVGGNDEHTATVFVSRFGDDNWILDGLLEQVRDGNCTPERPAPRIDQGWSFVIHDDGSDEWVPDVDGQLADVPPPYLAEWALDVTFSLRDAFEEDGRS